MYSYVKSGNAQRLTPDDGSGTMFTLPPSFAFVGSYPVASSLVNVTSAGNVMTIIPTNPQFEFQIYTDGDWRNEYQGVDVAPNFGLNVSNVVNKSNLQSANALINNTISRAAITTSNPFVTTITDFRPIKALYITANIPITSQSSSGKQIFISAF